MKKSLLFLTVAAALQSAEIPKHPRELKYAVVNYQPPKASGYRHKLASGAVAFVVEDHTVPLINISVTMRTGKYLEPAGKTGLAAITGSQMRSGGTKSRPPAKFDDEADLLAAQIGSSIDDVEGGAWLNCMAKDLDAAMILFLEMLRDPGFDGSRLKLAKTQILQALERRNDDSRSIAPREFTRLLRGPRHFSAIQATKASIDGIERQDLVDFHRKYYFPANFVLAVSGDFQTAAMVKRLEEAFSGWTGPREKVPLPTAADFTPAPGVYIVDKDVPQGRVRMGHLGVTVSNPDHLALSVMNGILGGGAFTSRIVSRVRSDEGLAYSSGSVIAHGDFYPGVFSAFFQTKSSTVAQAVTIVREEIDKIRSAPVKQEEFDTEVARAMESLPRRFATASAKAGQFATDYFKGLPEDYWQRYRDRIRELTPAELQRVAQKYLKPDQLLILVVGNAGEILKGNPDKPQYQLSKFGETKRIPLPDPLTMEYR